MFLSKLVLNIRDPKARRDLGDMYDMHRTLWKAFPGQDEGGAGRVLFRVDNDGAGPVALVQSAHQPDWRSLPVGYLRHAPEAKPFDPVFSAGQRLRFRLRANPTKRLRQASPVPERGEPNVVRVIPKSGGGTKSVGRRVGLLTENEQIGWLLRKGEDGGFTIPGSWVEAREPETNKPIRLPNFRVDVVPEGRLKGVKHDGSVLVVVRFEGVLVVSDPDKFRESLFAGIGSAKGFGFGLLSVAPA